MPNRSKACTNLARLNRRAVISVLAVGFILVISSHALGTALALGGAFVLKVILAFACVTIWLGTYLPSHLPQVRLGAANQVTLGRLALTVVLAGFLGESRPEIPWVALSIAAVVLALDGIDGWLARRSGSASAFGARFDMETDALLVLLLAVLVWQFDQAGVWVLLSGAMRYAFVAAALMRPWLRRPLPPNRRRKTVCVLQILSLLLALVPWIVPPWSEGVAVAGLVLLCYSFGVDIIWLWRQAGHIQKEPNVDEHS